jgi:serine/threonine-protein kinase RsbW
VPTVTMPRPLRLPDPAFRRWRYAALDLPAQPRSVPTGRRVARLILGSWSLGAIAEPAELIASELLTNAVTASLQSGQPIIRLRLTSRTYALTVEVWDGCGGRPEARRTAPADAPGGRGLVLVDALAQRWGCEPAAGGGKTTFAVIAQ